MSESARLAVLRGIFKLFDVDRKGGLKVDGGLQHLRRSVDHKEGEWNKGGRNAHLIPQLDTNGDGVVDIEEFARFFMKQFPAHENAFVLNARGLQEVGELLQATLSEKKRGKR